MRASATDWRGNASFDKSSPSTTRASTSRDFGPATAQHLVEAVRQAWKNGEIHESQEEGCRIVTQAIPVEVVEAEQPDQLLLRWGEAEMVPDPKGGRPRPVLQEDRMHLDGYDCIISAIGQGGNLEFIPGNLQEQLAIEWGKFIPGEYQHTALARVFVGGDVANSTADAISAIEDGHHAARGIDRFLNPAADRNAD